MSVPIINCAKCGNPMPANYEYCTNCGHTNAFIAPDSAIKPPLPRPGADAAGTVGETPIEGAPTVDMGSMGEQARYTPAEAASAAGAAGAASAWQPGQYAPEQPQVGQPGPNVAPPPGYSSGPMQPTQYSPPPMPAPGYGQPQYPYPSAPTQRKDSTVALLLELIGYAGFLGIGHIYAGRTSRGIALLVGGFIYLIASAVLTIVLVGICMFVAWLAVPILSGLWIKNDLDKTNAMLRR